MLAIRNALRGVHGSAKVGSCKAHCETVAGLIFVKTDGAVRPDLYSVDAFHYHLRVPRQGAIIDPTLYQFFQISSDSDVPVFVGSRDSLISELNRLVSQYGINQEVLTVATASTGEEMYQRLWGPARLKVSGARLYLYTGGRRVRGFYG